MLQHERLDVYARALELLRHVRTIAVDRLPRGSRTLAQRILSSCSSLVIDIASAAGQPSVGAQRRVYGAAIHAATKCGAILDVLRHLALIGEDEHVAAKEIVERIVAGLRRRIRLLEADRRATIPSRGNVAPQKVKAPPGVEPKASIPAVPVPVDETTTQLVAENESSGVGARRNHEPLLNAPPHQEMVMQT